MTESSMSEMQAKLVGFDQGPEMVVVVEGPDLLAVACNDAANAALGDREILGRPMRQLAGDLGGPRLLEMYADAYRSGEPSGGHAWRVQIEQADGSTAEHFLDFAMTPWRGEDGTVRGVIGSATDVTSRVRADDARGGTEEGSDLDTVMALQDALQPSALPVVPCLDIAARYLLAADEHSAGGDWFDAVVRTTGHVALVTGDVAGRGVPASAVMGQLRAVLHERLLGADSVETAIAGLDRYAAVRAESHAATVCVVDIDPDSGRFEYCTAGHPPPLVVSASGETRYLGPTGTGPLGTGSGIAVAEDGLAPAELLLLFTDGAIERPGASRSRSTVELARIAAEAALGRGPMSHRFRRPAERVCHVGMEHLVRTGGHADDIAMLAAHRVPPVLPFTVRLPATPSSVTRARAAMADWLDPLEVSPLDDMAVQHSVDELMTNAVTHAYSDQPAAGVVTIEARIDRTGELVCTVRDTGSWQPPTRTGVGGRGLAVVRGLADHLELHPGDGGTTATFRHRLGRPAQLLSATPYAHDAGRRRTVPYSSRLDDERFVVEGSLDLDASDQLRVDLQLATHGRSMPAVVDLTRVTYVGSCAVQVLHEVVAMSGAALVLHAPAGSVAQQVLELTRLPYDPGG
jgi:anti-sigma regulatory factor (Ser/Thr protein kinase)/anti-anti-sigma regulatory factor